MALEFDKEDLKYIKSTIEWMLENMELKDIVKGTESLHNLSMNSINALERGLAVGFNEETANIVSDSNYCKQCKVPIPDGFRFCSGECKQYYYR